MSELLIKAGSGESIARITPESAGWKYVGFEAIALAAGGTFKSRTEGVEACLVAIEGGFSVTTEGGESFDAPGRADPFTGAPDAVYLPPGTGYEIFASGQGAEVGICTAPAEGRLPARFLPGADLEREVRGYGNLERRIYPILMAGRDAESLLVCEVVTPDGHWSSYPPHKHDRDALPAESVLEETYYHRIQPEQGFAMQRVYADDGLDESMAVGNRDTVLVPRGYHTVSAPPGYTNYYLNVMAGPAREWAISDDPSHTWLQTPPPGDCRLGFDREMFILAFDHRGSFRRVLFGIEGEPDPEQTARISAAKRVVLDGLLAAVASGKVPQEAAGVLVDEQFGGDVPALAREHGVLLSMPAEKSDQALFDFEYGDSFGDHIASHGVSFTKVLVRQNPEGDPEGNRIQLERLKRLADWLHEQETPLLYELLVPPTEKQLAAVGGDQERFERELRPGLMRKAIADAQDAGVEVDIWKVEGLYEKADAEALVAQARNAPHREQVVCVLLGAGASDDRVRDWMEIAASTEGFAGFAIGRTIWKRPLERLLAGEIEREEAIAAIADKYREFVRFYLAAGNR